MMSITLEFSAHIRNMNCITYGQLHHVHLKWSRNSNSEKRVFTCSYYFTPSFSGASIVLFLMQKEVGIFSFVPSQKPWPVLLKFVHRGWKSVCKFIFDSHDWCYTVHQSSFGLHEVAASGNYAHLHVQASCSLVAIIMNCICTAVVKYLTWFINIEVVICKALLVK